MPKYFIVSDIHSFFIPLKEALGRAGYRKTNKDHILIINGDIYDRGKETLDVYNFIKSIPKFRRILISGNHEGLYKKLLTKNYPDSYDFSNGTVSTFCQIANINPDLMDKNYYVRHGIKGNEANDTMVSLGCDKVLPAVEKSEVTKFIKSNEGLNYYELDKYIITHAFIPLQIKNDFGNYDLPIYAVDNIYLEPIPNGRTEAMEYQWEESKGPCPGKAFRDGLFNEELKNNKVLICGHGHSSDFHHQFEDDPFMSSEYDNTDIFYSNNLIAIDACTALSKRVNVLVIDDRFNCFDQYGRKLESKCEIKIKTPYIIETVCEDSRKDK